MIEVLFILNIKIIKEVKESNQVSFTMKAILNIGG